ncbi:MAG: NAD(P)H-binding protein [Devosia sp.]
MKLAVLGATGRTGRLVVQAAIKRGHTVTALTRGKPPSDQNNLKWVKGDIGSRRALHDLIEGQDAVISALGPNRQRQDVCSVATANLIAIGVKRLIVVSGAAVDAPDDSKDIVGRVVSYAVSKLSPAVFADKQHELSLLLGSEAEWTAARAPRLTDGNSRRPIRARLDRSAGTKVERIGLAEFCLDCAEHGSFVRQAPFVSN